MRKSHKERKKQPRFAIHELLRGAGQVFSPKQQVLVAFLYQNYQKVAFMTITELAKETKVSEATIVRSANLLGFDGYPSLQKAVQKLVTQDLTSLERLQVSLEQHELDKPMQRSLKIDMRNLMRLYQHVSREEVDRAVRCLVAAERVVVAGYMSSSPLAVYLGYGLNRLGRKVTTYTEDEVRAKRAVFDLTSKDLLVGIAFPRYPISLLNLLKIAASRGIPRLGFTDSAASPLANITDPCVFLPFELLAVVDSLAAPISFLSGLMAEVVKRDPKRTARGLEEFESFLRKFELLYREGR